MQKRIKKQFTKQELIAKGFMEEEDGGETYLTYTRHYLPLQTNYLITNDFSSEENDSYFVDYGYTSKHGSKPNRLTNLDEEIIDLFIHDLGIIVEVESWFEKLISR